MKIMLPKLSATMEEGTIVKWLKQVGDAIREGDMLYEVETDKTTMEIESSVTGVLAQILVPAGKVIPVGTEIGEITLDAAKSAQPPAQQASSQQAQTQQASSQQAQTQQASTQQASYQQAQTQQASSQVAQTQQASSELAQTQQASSQQAQSLQATTLQDLAQKALALHAANQVAPSASIESSATVPVARSADAGTAQVAANFAQPESTRLRISPSARRLARTWNIDTSQIQGSGPMGRIRNRDVEAVVTSFTSKPSVNRTAIPSATPFVKPSVTPSELPTSISAGSSVAPMQAGSDIPKMRMTLAKEMLRSTHTIPAFWVEKWVNADLVLKWKELLKQTKGQAFAQVTITDFILHAMGLALLEMPSVNRRWVVNQQGVASIVQVSGSHVGLAISVDNGILSPILADVGELLLSNLIQVRQEAVAMTRSYKPYGLSEPAAITLSNLGHAGVDRFQAIVKPDETMILAVGGIQEKVIAVNGQFAVQQGFNLVLTADHRVLDGVDAAKFLAKIAEILESGAWKIA